MIGTGLPLRVTWHLDGLDLNGAPDALGREWVVSGEDGWSGSAPPRTNRTPRLWADGSNRGRPFRDERVIRLDGWVACPTWEARRDAEHRLAALCAGPDLYPLTCREENGAWVAWVELDDVARVAIAPGGHDLDFSLQVVAPDPLRYSADEQRAETSLPRSGDGGLMFDPPGLSGVDFTAPGYAGLNFGEPDSSGSVVVTNTGNAPAPLAIEVYGPVSAPVTVWQPSTGRRLTFSRALSATESLVLDTGARTARVNGADFRHLLTDAEWFRAPPGESRVMWSHGGGFNPTARLVIRWRHTRY